MMPIMTSAEDVEAVVGFLRTRATGATVTEIRAVLEAKLLDSRKLSGYEYWGFISRDGDRLKLTELGRALARASQEERADIYSESLRSIKPYVLALEWIHFRSFDQVTGVEVATHWYEHSSADLGTDNENTITSQVVCFFNLVDAAGLGQRFVGRRGQPTRLELNRKSLDQFFSGSHDGMVEFPRATTGSHNGASGDGLDAAVRPDVALDMPILPTAPETTVTATTAVVLAGNPKVFIAHGKNKEIVEQIKTMLDLAGLSYEVAVDTETTAIPVPDKVLDAMRRCQAAVICVTADGQPRAESGDYAVNENVLIEIGAAFVLYDRKVVLVWDKRLPVPSNLQGLYRCEFEGDELSWSAGMKLMKAVGEFRKGEMAPVS